MERFFVDYLERLEALLQDFEPVIRDAPPEALNWQPGPDMNSLGVLVLHTAGATRFLIGDLALGEPAPRDRDGEFAAQDVTATELNEQLASTIAHAREAVTRLTLDDLERVRQLPGRTSQRTVSWALLHALEHAAQHLGHAQLTRQLWDDRNP